MKTMFKVIFVSLLILVVSVFLFNFIGILIPVIPKPVITALSISFFVTYVFVNFDKFTAKQVAIDKYENKHKGEKIKLSNEQKKVIFKKYLSTWIVFFVILLIVNFLNLNR